MNQDKDVFDKDENIISRSIGKNKGQNYTLLMVCDTNFENEFYEYLETQEENEEDELIVLDYRRLKKKIKNKFQWVR